MPDQCNIQNGIFTKLLTVYEKTILHFRSASNLVFLV
jgi:hypothetical protein